MNRFYPIHQAHSNIFTYSKLKYNRTTKKIDSRNFRWILQECANWRLWILESVFWGFWWEFHESGILKERTLTVQLLLEKKAEFSYLCFFSWSEGQFPRNWSSIFLYLRVKTAQVFLVRSKKLVFYLSEKANFCKQTSNFSFAPSFTRNRQINP